MFRHRASRLLPAHRNILWARSTSFTQISLSTSKFSDNLHLVALSDNISGRAFHLRTVHKYASLSGHIGTSRRTAPSRAGGNLAETLPLVPLFSPDTLSRGVASLAALLHARRLSTIVARHPVINNSPMMTLQMQTPMTPPTSSSDDHLSLTVFPSTIHVSVLVCMVVFTVTYARTLSGEAC